MVILRIVNFNEYLILAPDFSFNRTHYGTDFTRLFSCGSDITGRDNKLLTKCKMKPVFVRLIGVPIY